MPPPLILRIIGDATNYFKTAESTIAANTKLATSFAEVGKTAKLSADAEIAAGTKAIAASRARVAELTAANTRLAGGSDAAIAGQVALADANAKLNRQLGISSVGLRGSGEAAATAERDFGKLTRGVLAGSGVAASLGRSLAFASTGFIAVAGGATLLTSSIKAALTLAATQRQVDAQLKTTGKTWDQYGTRIDAADLKISHVSGFTNQELLQSFGYLVRVTGNVSTSLRLNSVAADVARGRHIALSSASLALAKALGGSNTALRRLGIIIPTNLKGMEALNYVSAKFAGQAKAGATVSDRFHASLVNTEEIIGTALLPTFERLTTRLGNWLAKMNETGRLQRDVNEAVRVGGDVFHTLGNVIHTVDRVTGSFKKTLELLVAFKFASIVTGWIVKLGALATEWGIVGAAATTAGAAEAAALAEGAGGGVVGAAARGAGAGGGVVAAGRFASKAAAIEAAAPFAPFAAVVAIAAQSPVQGPRSLKIQGYTSDGQPLAQGSDGKPYIIGGRGYREISQGEMSSWSASFVGVAGAPVITRQVRNFPRTGNIVPSAFQVPGFQPARPNIQQLPVTTHTGPIDFGVKPITVWASYQLTIAEQIAQVQAALTKTTADDVAVAKGIIARIKRLIDSGHLAGNSLIQALQDEASAQGVIDSARQAAAQKAAQIAVAAKAAASSYTTPIDIQLAQARAQLTTTSRDDIAAARAALADAKRALASGRKNKQGQLAAIQAEIQAQQTLDSLRSQSATSFTQPLRLQLALAKAQATGADQTPILKRMKAALERALKATKGNIQKQIDIYNQIAAINSQLGSTTGSLLGGFKQASTRALTRGLGLTVEQREALRARLSQLGPGGTVPGSGVGAGGYVIDPKTGRPAKVGRAKRGGSSYGSPTAPVGGRPSPFNPTFDFNIYIDGKQVEARVTQRQQKRRSQNPSQRRGPNAGMAGA